MGRERRRNMIIVNNQGPYGSYGEENILAHSKGFVVGSVHFAGDTHLEAEIKEG
jgi:hypothetical protein